MPVLDLYTHAVSDVYQDLFGEGIYIGKGIYDVSAFQRSLEGRVPENALASHDLFEGIHGRAALVSDVVVYEDYPSHYLAYARRLHRWIRGDWQLVPWLRRRVPGAEGGRLPNRLSGLGRWKIFDNLRRSLFAPILFCFLLAGWSVLPGQSVAVDALGCHGARRASLHCAGERNGARRSPRSGSVGTARLAATGARNRRALAVGARLPGPRVGGRRRRGRSRARANDGHEKTAAAMDARGP